MLKALKARGRRTLACDYREADMKRETETTLLAAHNQVITKNAVKVKTESNRDRPCAGCTKKRRNPLDMYYL